MTPHHHSALLLVLSVLWFTGCAANTWNNSNKIALGMTKAELITAIGQPEDSMSPGVGVEVLRYRFLKPRLVRIPPAVPLKKIYLVRGNQIMSVFMRVHPQFKRDRQRGSRRTTIGDLPWC